MRNFSNWLETLLKSVKYDEEKNALTVKFVAVDVDGEIVIFLAAVEKNFSRLQTEALLETLDFAFALFLGIAFELIKRKMLRV